MLTATHGINILHIYSTNDSQIHNEFLLQKPYEFLQISITAFENILNR